MAFWGVEVKPGKPFTHTADDARGRLHISQATLGIGTAPKKSVVQCNVGDKSPVFLCSLFPEKAESCQLNLEFEEADEVVFSVIGPQSVHLTGYFLGASGQRYNLNDELESYGEDIADTETERSTGHSDEDKYDDSFINDADLDIIPPSPVSGGGEIEEIPDRQKGSRRRLRKKNQLSGSDDDASAQKEIEEIPDRQKGSRRRLRKKNQLSGSDDDASAQKEIEEIPDMQKGSHRRLRKNYQLIDSDDDVSAQKQMLADGSTAAAASDGESEDMQPISSLCKVSSDEQENIETREKNVRKSGGTSTYEAKDEGNCFILSEERSDDDVNGEPKRSDMCDSVLPSAEVGLENGVKPKKKKKVQSQEGTQVEEKGLQNDTETDKIIQNLPVPNKENQKTFNHVENVGSVNNAKPKKRKRKEQQKSLEADSVDCTNVIKGDKALHDEVKHDRMGQDTPGRVEQNEQQVTDVIPGNDVDQSVAELQPEKKKKKKKRRTEEDGKDSNMETHPLSMDAMSGSVMVTENSSAEGKLSLLRTLPNGLVIQKLGTGKPDGKVAAPGKKISVLYTGKLKENGQVFDSNLGSTPLKFHLGGKEVIEGLNVGLEGMHVGEKRRLLIPPSLGYGSGGDDSKNIPPYSWLEFDVDLVKVHR
ncbi:peptidyl-prolyl cis-trans isomerase FKBP43 isoform X11 [Citrus sinensis]|uniref:peptidyl-prolyl cis-trans isomerase FKBP43 isoform X7 n=1 Tax=Citrus sinensis TaxID=2711 RepID=UPI0022785BB8|nr:peptidyl-prolyl cis-trans isomerase FKBP43 isoform X7 [Citrus sinensis]XP_052293652.1 peptidyl-prolyl cis-trans isomerase FKBP43 isoform X8 [Citrus sinensis]XP_052293653.1 peptidyl-prolyl cis-trans isomerase FKBP43 isoform X9 [Citrus sinensis]XP_052293654.1 peptidyl-prolyl cis-trans isomerase FKBP43 isoform X10 [Citrus sinensis]XP_052293655.1 peptidyl-prolyl cis-trans isomerase FKBP43 isoform X11 [Citrus sinensis]